MSQPEIDCGDVLLDELEHGLRAREERAFVARSRRENIRVHALQMIILVLLLLAWWAASGTLVDSLYLSNPISVLRALYQIVVDGTLWRNLQMDADRNGARIRARRQRWTGTCDRGDRNSVGGPKILRPMMLGLFAIPKVALEPLIIVWFGISYLVPKSGPGRFARSLYRIFQHGGRNHGGQSANDRRSPYDGRVALRLARRS